MKRPLGQHFIFDTNILNKILDCSSINSKDTVVEVGPGLGIMTGLLADRAKKVYAIEYDRKLIKNLNDNLGERGNVEVIRADALKFPYEDISGSFKVVSNIPYYIATPLLFRFLDYKERISSMTLLLQKEVGQRIIARAGSKDYGVLSISTQLYTAPAIKFIVGRKVFSPPPDVDSAVVYFDVFAEPRFAVKDPAFFIKIVKTAFSQRRKTILNGLKAYAGIREALAASGIDPALRPENLSIDDFTRLSNELR